MSKLLSETLMLLAGEPTHWCPGCRMMHRINVNAPNEHTGARWTWNGDPVRPTFSPSVKIPDLCHYHIRDGRIEFCTDSQHHLTGKTVDLPPIPQDDRDD